MGAHFPRPLTARPGGGRSKPFAMSTKFYRRRELHRRASGSVGSSPRRAASRSNIAAGQLTWRGAPGAASEAPGRAGRRHRHEPTACRKRGIQAQGPAAGSPASVPVQFRLLRCWGVGHSAQTRFAFPSSASSPMNPEHTSWFSVILLMSSKRQRVWQGEPRRVWIHAIARTRSPSITSFPIMVCRSYVLDQPAPPNAGIAPRLAIEHRRLGVGEPGRLE